MAPRRRPTFSSQGRTTKNLVYRAGNATFRAGDLAPSNQKPDFFREGIKGSPSPGRTFAPDIRAGHNQPCQTRQAKITPKFELRAILDRARTVPITAEDLQRVWEALKQRFPAKTVDASALSPTEEFRDLKQNPDDPPVASDNEDNEPLAQRRRLSSMHEVVSVATLNIPTEHSLAIPPVQTPTKSASESTLRAIYPFHTRAHPLRNRPICVGRDLHYFPYNRAGLEPPRPARTSSRQLLGSMLRGSVRGTERDNSMDIEDCVPSPVRSESSAKPYLLPTISPQESSTTLCDTKRRLNDGIISP
ncbi:hypothetical protein QBC38DRAFT_450857 [Podospora fimiseda]|uniref:Uncharacterized protein n=1 Tax=Podospora fimiseda TaxID=252190 RepID=A0AAN7BYJ6_9PEZI|nr:hypothetical protein QBC38DRAFT_450857 [Podospora fimiseda]